MKKKRDALQRGVIALVLLVVVGGVLVGFGAQLVSVLVTLAGVLVLGLLLARVFTRPRRR